MKKPVQALLLSPWSPVIIGTGWMVASILAFTTPLLPSPSAPALTAVTTFLFASVLAGLFISQAFIYVQGVVLLMGLAGHIAALMLPSVSDHLAMIITLVAFCCLACMPHALSTYIRARIWGTMDHNALMAWLRTHHTTTILALLEQHKATEITAIMITNPVWGNPGLLIDNDQGTSRPNALECAVIEGLQGRLYTGDRLLFLNAGPPTAHQRLAMHTFVPRTTLAQNLRSVHLPNATACLLIALVLSTAFTWVDHSIQRDRTHQAWVLDGYRQALSQTPHVLPQEASTWLHERAQGARAYPVRAFQGQFFLVCVDTPGGVSSYATYHTHASNTMQRDEDPASQQVFAHNLCAKGEPAAPTVPEDAT